MAVCCDYKKELTKFPEEVSKERGKCNSLVHLKESDFKYIIFNKMYKEFFNEEFLKIIAVTEFAKTFSGIEKIMLDGEIKKSSMEMIKKLIHPFKLEILAEARADQLYPAVHSADAIANLLFRYYGTRHLENRKKYEDKRIIPDFVNYQGLFK